MNLKDLRLQLELTTHEVADQLQIVESTVRNWESGRTIPRLRLDQFQHLCEIYKCTFDELCAAFQATKAQAKKRTGKNYENLLQEQTRLSLELEHLETDTPALLPLPTKYTEADIRQNYVLPQLEAAGWNIEPHSVAEEVLIDQVVLDKNKLRRKFFKRADLLLRYTRDFIIAVVEVKNKYSSPSNGIQQAQDYAHILGLKFAYFTNGYGILEFDAITDKVSQIDSFPTPEQLWERLQFNKKLDGQHIINPLLIPDNNSIGSELTYYQKAAINQVIQAILQKKERMLLEMQTGTGKTMVIFQICWKLWNAHWNLENNYRRPKILYLSDRNGVVENAKNRFFALFGQAFYKLESEVNKGRDIYFATYQSLLEASFYKEYSPNFFDLIIADECNSQSIISQSSWQEILVYFNQAYQLGVLNPLPNDDNKDFSQYFGESLYKYSFEQSNNDGFLWQNEITLSKTQNSEQTNSLKNKTVVNNHLEVLKHKTKKQQQCRSYFVNNKEIEIIDYTVYEWDSLGNQRVVPFVNYTAENIRALYKSLEKFYCLWIIPEERTQIIEQLEKRGISFEELASATKHFDADPFDLLCHLAFNIPLRTSRERATKVRQEQQAFFSEFNSQAQQVLNDLLEIYAECGFNLFKIPYVLKIPLIANRGNVSEIAAFFGNANKLRDAILQLQTLLYTV